MKKIVFVDKPGAHKSDQGWMCKDEFEANSLVGWLKHLGVVARTMSEDDHAKLPDRAPE